MDDEGYSWSHENADGVIYTKSVETNHHWIQCGKCGGNLEEIWKQTKEIERKWYTLILKYSLVFVQENFKMWTSKNLVFLSFRRSLEVFKSSGRPVGRISTQWRTSKLPWSRVMTKKSKKLTSTKATSMFNVSVEKQGATRWNRCENKFVCHNSATYGHWIGLQKTFRGQRVERVGFGTFLNPSGPSKTTRTANILDATVARKI